MQVIIYFSKPSDASRAEVAGAKFDHAIETRISRLRALASQGRPSGSLSSEEERDWMQKGRVGAPIDLTESLYSTAGYCSHVLC